MKKEITGITHSNGDRPYTFHIDKSGRCFIYKKVDYLTSNGVENVYLGEKNTSLLIEVNIGSVDNAYHYIGHKRFSFLTPEKITSFTSKIGNSDVLYPYAESKNLIYILLDNVYFKKPKITEGYDVYDYYYANKKSLKLNSLSTIPELPEN